MNEMKTNENVLKMKEDYYKYVYEKVSSKWTNLSSKLFHFFIVNLMQQGIAIQFHWSDIITR